MGPLSYRVQVYQGMVCKRHADQPRGRVEKTGKLVEQTKECIREETSVPIIDMAVEPEFDTGTETEIATEPATRRLPRSKHPPKRLSYAQPGNPITI